MIEVKCKSADLKAIDELTEFQGNLKKLSKENERKLRNSIEQNGFIAPIFIWDNEGKYKILDGHQRLAVLLKMRQEGENIPLLPVDYIHADSEEDAKKKLLYITSQYGEFTTEGFEEFTFDLSDFDDIRLTDGEFDLSFMEKEDEAQEDDYEIPDEIETDIKIGDMFQIGEHRLMCGDSTDAEMVGKLMGVEKADMVFTDPPYGVSYVGKTKDALTIENDNLKPDQLAEKIKEWFNIVDLFIRDGSYLLATVPPGPLFLLFANDWNERGWLRQMMVWNKDSMVLGRGEYHYKHEPILFGWKKGDRLKSSDRTKTTVWNFKRPKVSKDHPTMKPVKMLAYGITNHSKKNDLLYEPFLGSGTTMVAAHQLSRKCYGMELDPKYCQVIIDRMKALDKNLTIEKIENE